jgi:hypothetical protein
MMTLRIASTLLDDWIRENPNKDAEQERALRKYGDHFRTESLAGLGPEEFREFLDFKNNKHWRGIGRHKSEICPAGSDMKPLKAVLGVLLDESQPIQHRLDRIADKHDLYVKWLGPAILTPVLMCVHPNKYAVYNRISEGALIGFDLLKAKPTGSLGSRYAEINEVCLKIASDIGQSLRRVDTMFALIAPMMSSDDEEDSVVAMFGYEGRRRLRTHWRRERRPKLIRAKKDVALHKFGNLSCEVCAFVFTSRYGDHGSGFVECHHRQPLSKITDEGKKVTLDDLALVCANCHRMLHRKDWPAIEELRRRLLPN